MTTDTCTKYGGKNVLRDLHGRNRSQRGTAHPMKTGARLRRWRGCRVTLARSIGLAAFLVMTAVTRLSVPGRRSR